MTIYRCKNNEHTPRNSDFNQKNDESILEGGDFITIKPMKTYQNSICNVPLRHIDCLSNHSEAVIYPNEGVVIYSHAKTTFESTLRSANSFDSKPMKTCIYSRRLLLKQLIKAQKAKENLADNRVHNILRLFDG